MRKYFFLLFSILYLNLSANITEIKIGVLYGLSLTEINVSGQPENAKIFFDSIPFFNRDTLYQIKIAIAKDSLHVYAGDSLIAQCKTVKIIGNAFSKTHLNHLNFKQEKIYADDIYFQNNNGFLFVINNIEIENYLPGVLEAEVGLSRPPEYYKVQAIICRTYTLSHLRRHEMEDFNLCDKEHCQVYKGWSKKENEITKAVEKTEGVVIVDSEFMLITAAFHANCGGQTVNSEDVWNKKLDYLRSIKDTFCLNQKSALWSKEFSEENWIQKMFKLCKSYNIKNDSLFLNGKIFFVQKSRKSFYDLNESCQIPLKDMRNLLELRSTYFNAEYRNGQVILHGRGFGHGVGLCQDGAIRMSKLGYSYKSILHFYYQNVSIVHLDKLDFFRFNE